MKRYAIVYSSATGNTEQLARKIKEALPGEQTGYFGPPDLSTVESPILFVGFWTNKGNCDKDTIRFLKRLRGKQVFLFGTAGFGTSVDYYKKILSAVQMHMDSSNTVIGTYMCQGRMPVSVRRRYEALQEEEQERAQGLLANFDLALTHPDKEDLEKLQQAVWTVL